MYGPVFDFRLRSVYVSGSDGLIGNSRMDIYYINVVFLYFRDTMSEPARLRV